MPPARLGLVTLRARAEFLAVRGGIRWSGPAFVLEGRPRAPSSPVVGPRFGFVVTKRLGPAVVRNRIKRRLREALRSGPLTEAASGFDYVVVARAPALRRPFVALVADFRQGLGLVRRKSAKPQP